MISLKNNMLQHQRSTSHNDGFITSEKHRPYRVTESNAGAELVRLLRVTFTFKIICCMFFKRVLIGS